MFEYSREMEWALTRVRFDYLGGVYNGRGLMEWEPQTGFTVNAFFEPKGVLVPKEVQLGKIRVPRPSELRALRMDLGGGRWAISPQLLPGEHIELLGEHRLSERFPSMLFRSQHDVEVSEGKYTGCALFELGKKTLALPNRLERETRLQGKRIKVGLSPTAIEYQADDLKLRGWMESASTLKVEWVLCSNRWARRDAWRWAEALQSALSFLAGRTVQLLERTTRRVGREYVERRAKRPVEYLGLLSMPPRKTRTPERIDAEQLIGLTRFFMRGGRQAFTARQMCAQMADASRQSTSAAQELLCANVLDAALRTLMNCRYQKKDTSTRKIDPIMNRFRTEYLSQGAWEEPCKSALRAYHCLRHRNAHPDWLTEHGGGLAPDEVEQSTDHMVRLAWFYGYMILALAGSNDLEPEFPSQLKKWGPLLTMHSGSTSPSSDQESDDGAR